MSGNVWHVDFLQRLELNTVHLHVSSLAETVKYCFYVNFFPLVFFPPYICFAKIVLMYRQGNTDFVCLHCNVYGVFFCVINAVLIQRD